MKALVLGLPRTGTQSIGDALAQLGISPVYHMREVGKNQHQDLWIEALEAKFEGKGARPWRRQEFDRILRGYEALADYPAAIFPEELMAAYPEAVVILSTRPPAAWRASMLATLIHSHARRRVDDASPMAQLARKYHWHCWKDDFLANGGAFFHAHNSAVREAGRGRRFLEYEAGSGWEPLCTLLGVDVPDAPFPRSDDWAYYKKEVEEEKKTERGGGLGGNNLSGRS